MVHGRAGALPGRRLPPGWLRGLRVPAPGNPHAAGAAPDRLLPDGTGSPRYGQPGHHPRQPQWLGAAPPAGEPRGRCPAHRGGDLR